MGKFGEIVNFIKSLNLTMDNDRVKMKIDKDGLNLNFTEKEEQKKLENKKGGNKN